MYKAKKCLQCGELFTPVSAPQKCCNRPIRFKCVICGKEFDTVCNVKHPQCCSEDCRKKYAHQKSVEAFASTTKQCVLCGKEFHPKTNTQVVCEDDHYRICVICGKQFKINWHKGMTVSSIAKTCSSECRMKAAFDGGALGNTPEAREKAKQTCLKRYGVEHPMHSAEIKSRIVKTNRERYGADHFVQTPEYLEKAKATNQMRYGVDWARQNPEIQKKSEETLYSHYGVTQPMASPEIRSKVSETYKRATGYDNPMQNPAVKDKVAQTNLKRYGVAYPAQVPEIQEKATNTMQTRYGGRGAFDSPILAERIKQTNLIKYGHENAASSPEVQAKISETMFKKYGVHRFNESWEYRASVMTDPTKVQEWRSFLEDPRTYVNAHFDHKPTYKELSETLGVNDSSIQVHLGCLNVQDIVQYTSSYLEDEICDILHKINPNAQIIRHNRSIISPYEVDIYLPEYQLGIEVNPTATHNSTYGSHGNPPKTPNYHRLKTDMCESQGIFLFHIFGYEWTHKRDIILSMLKNLMRCNTTTIYARNCSIREVSGKDAYDFLQNNHRQGGVHSKIRYGLYYQDELVSLMTFGKMRNSLGTGGEDLSDCWELVRFCSKLDTSVVGGASKLFAHFVRCISPTRVRSFSDRAHTSGKLYPQLGFVPVANNAENYVWVDLSDNQAYNRVNAQKHNLKRFLKDDTLDLTQTERQIMEAHGFVRVYDSGTITWQWSSP